MQKRKPIQSFITARSKVTATPLQLLFFPCLLHRLVYLDLRHYVASHVSEHPIQRDTTTTPIYTNSIGSIVIYNPKLAGAVNGLTITHDYHSSNRDAFPSLRPGPLQRLKSFYQYLKSKIV